MSISISFRLFCTKFPQSLLKPRTPIFKTLVFSTQSTPQNLSFFKPISIERAPTNRPLSASSSTSVPLQPIEDLPPKLQEIVKLFQAVPEPKAKYQQLLFYGQNLNPLSTHFKTRENKVQGCVSQVWVRAYLDANKNVVFEADSDSVLTKGLAALLVQGLSGRPVEEILRVSPDFVVLLGLQQSLTPSRNNGFLNMLRLMQKKALQVYVEAEKSSELDTQLAFSKEEDQNPVEDSQEDQNPDGDLNSGSETGESDGDSSSDGDSGSSSDDGGVLGSRGERIRAKLEAELKPTELQVEDISYQHAGHAGVRDSDDGETHFNVKVVSSEFEGKSLVKRHRLVYELLQDELQSGLHALSIVAKTPSEADSR